MDKKDDDKKTGPAKKRWVGCEVEADYFGDQTKASREERKRLSAKDRSKYKKTDAEKRRIQEQAAFDPEILTRQGLSRGRAISILSQGIAVYAEGRDYLCELRGTIKKERTKKKNLVVVGDFVWFEQIGTSEGVIYVVEPRETLLARADNLSRRLQQLIAANIEQVLITVSVMRPPLKPPLIDRYIIAARQGGMTPIVVINKIDLLEGASDTQEQNALFQAALEAYPKAGIKVLTTSATTAEGLEALRRTMQGSSSVFSGQSGTGKTSLINAMLNLDLPTKETVKRTRKGAHTTTTANLLPLVGGGFCIDTPGIKSFGVWDLKADEVEAYFSEIHVVGRKCKFSNCSHTHESDCAVKAALDTRDISALRYHSYVALRKEAETGTLPR